MMTQPVAAAVSQAVVHAHGQDLGTRDTRPPCRCKNFWGGLNILPHMKRPAAAEVMEGSIREAHKELMAGISRMQVK